MSVKKLETFLLCSVLWVTFGIVGAEEPMMDISIFLTSRVGAINSLKEGNLKGAIAGERMALKITEDQNGRTSLSLVPILTDEAVLHWDLAEYQEAEQELKWALALQEKNLGPDDPKVADSLDPLAALYTDLDRMVEAELLEKRALGLRQGAPNADPQALAKNLGLLAHIEGRMGNKAEQLKLYQRAYNTLKALPHPDLTLAMDISKGFASALTAQKQFSRAATCLEANLEFTQKNFSSDSVEVGNASMDLADFERQEGEFEKAEPLYKTAKNINQRFVGTDDEYATLPYLIRLARINEGLGDLQAAADLWQRTLDVEKRVFGPSHPRIAITLYHLAETESSLKKEGKAKEHLQQAVAILKKHFSSDHPLVAKIRLKLSADK